MPRTGTSQHVDDEWRLRVRERLKELGHTPAWLARESGAPRSLISELLSGVRGSTTYLIEIHEALRWPAPRGPLLSRDNEELLAIAGGLGPEDFGALKERARTLAEQRRRK